MFDVNLRLFQKAGKHFKNLIKTYSKFISLLFQQELKVQFLEHYHSESLE